MPTATIFSRFLDHLDVPHTTSWSDSQFKGMTFKSLFGLSHLLTEYGVRNQGLRIADRRELLKLSPPFLAQMDNGIFVIVKGVDEKAARVDYDSRGDLLQADLESFLKAWNGIALLAFPDENSREPEYASHRLTEIVANMSRYALALAALAIFAYFFITRNLYANVSTILLTVFNCAGLYFSYLLVQKSLNIHTAASDRVCGVLEHGGCDAIMQLKASKFLGVISWSEIGFGYFGISLLALLIFPDVWPYLAVFNVCCLPYTVWSIWYQKFRAHHWCTLCVCVQTTLWALFFCYLGGGFFGHVLPLHINFIILLAAYAFAVLGLNTLFGVFKNLPCHEKNS